MAGTTPQWSDTPEGQNPDGDNAEVPRRPRKEPMRPNETIDQGYTEGGTDQGYYDDDDYHQTEVEKENELLRQWVEEAFQANEEMAHQL